MIGVDLAQYKPISSWAPQVGDTVFWHGWFQHWFGLVSSFNSQTGQVSIVKAGLPVLLLSLTPAEVDKNKVELHVSEIQSAKPGEYAAIQIISGAQVWFI